MAGNKTFHCQLITPEAAMVDVRAEQVVFTAHDGEVGILLNRAPLLCKLGIGEMRVTTEQGTQRFYVDGGFAHV
ncbi:MAG: F0F1 ATP synthase subunit epsilon, partial [Planctomycetes bacterium]|nr:F0F1 ATP synthase subunit epsilon [Planctomycetota bacterium]